MKVDFPAPLPPIIAVRDDRESEHEASISDGFDAPGYVYETLLMRMMARVCDLTPLKIPGGGNLNWTCDADRV